MPWPGYRHDSAQPSTLEMARTSPPPADVEAGRKEAQTLPSLPAFDHTNYLTGRVLYGALIALNFANLVANVDLWGAAAILATVAKDFRAGSTITWAATSSLVTMTIGSCLSGYLSDFFGRKNLLLCNTVLFVVGALFCATCDFTESPEWFFVCRAMQGWAVGSISNLVNIAQNDFVRSKDRPKYQGLQGSSVALGSLVGVLSGAALALSNVKSRLGWPMLYYMEAGLGVVATIAIWRFVPAKALPTEQRSLKEIMKRIDWFGIVFGTGAIVPGLIFMTEGGNYGWSSPQSMSLVVISGVCLLLYTVTGFKNPCEARQIVEFGFFKRRTLLIIYLQNFCFGSAYYSYVVFMPMYWQNVRNRAPLTAALYMIPYIVTHGLWSTISGPLTKHKVFGDPEVANARGYQVIGGFGFACWAMAMYLHGFAHPNASVQGLCILGAVVGVGTGSVFQNSVNAIRSQVTPEEQARAIGTRNVLRYLGGAIGTAATSTIAEHRLKSQLPDDLDRFSRRVFTKPNLTGLGRAQIDVVHLAYYDAIKWVFVLAGAVISVCFVLSFFIKEGEMARRVAPAPSNFAGGIVLEQRESTARPSTGSQAKGDDAEVVISEATGRRSEEAAESW